MQPLHCPHPPPHPLILIQVAAMLSILIRYNWQQFSIVTSEIAGHDDFIQSVRDKVAAMKAAEEFRSGEEGARGFQKSISGT